MTERERGTWLRELDRKVLEGYALGHLKAMAPEVEWLEAQPEYRYVAGEAEDGLYVVCTEGVGWKVGPGEPFVMGVRASWLDLSGERCSSMVANNEVYLSLYEVTKAMEFGVDTDLADFVRSFGSRLEANFGIWHRKFNPKPKRVRKAAKK